MKEVPIRKTTRVALVDDEDYARVMLFKWDIKGTAIFCKRAPVGHAAMGRYILQIEKKTNVEYLNGDRLQ